MNESSTSHLKIFTEALPQSSLAVLDGLESIPDVLKAFHRTTGWELKYVPDADPHGPTDLTWSAPVNPGVGTTLSDTSGSEPAGSDAGRGKSAAVEPMRNGRSALASALSAELGEFAYHDSDMLSGSARPSWPPAVPLVQSSRADESSIWPMRLQAVLKGGAEAVGCQAAAIYTARRRPPAELKLRSSCWGLPPSRLTEPARPLGRLPWPTWKPLLGMRRGARTIWR